MEFIVPFALDTAAGLVGVFAGVVLALWTDRKREQRQHAREQATLQEDLAQSRRLVLSSVVNNTSEAKRFAQSLTADDDPYVFQANFELSVWEANQIQFMRLASVDERVLLSRFFGHVAHLMRLIEFHRHLRVQLELRPQALDFGDRDLLRTSIERLRSVADELRIDGLVVVTDLGESMHQRLLGMSGVAEPS